MPRFKPSPVRLVRSTTVACAFAATSLLGASSWAGNTTPIVLTFSTTGDSRQDPNNYDQASVGTTLTGQDAIWLQNTKALARILRTIQSQKASMLFFNGDMIHGYGWGAFGYASNADQSKINGASKSQTPVPDAQWTTST